MLKHDVGQVLDATRAEGEKAVWSVSNKVADLNYFKSIDYFVELGKLGESILLNNRVE